MVCITSIGSIHTTPKSTGFSEQKKIADDAALFLLRRVVLSFEPTIFFIHLSHLLCPVLLELLAVSAERVPKVGFSSFKIPCRLFNHFSKKISL